MKLYNSLILAFFAVFFGIFTSVSYASPTQYSFAIYNYGKNILSVDYASPVFAYLKMGDQIRPNDGSFQGSVTLNGSYVPHAAYVHVTKTTTCALQFFYVNGLPQLTVAPIQGNDSCGFIGRTSELGFSWQIGFAH